MRYLPFPMIALASLLVFTTAPKAGAAEVDFFQFRTKHSAYSDWKTHFRIRVLETSYTDSRLNKKAGYDCTVSSEAPGHYFCIVKGRLVVVTKAKASLYKLLGEANSLNEQDVVTFEERPDGLFQVTLKDDRFFQVAIPAPVVSDDTMSCEVAVIGQKMKADFRCKSELHPSKKFQVLDVPLVSAQNGDYSFGGAASDKVSELLTLMYSQKKVETPTDLSQVHEIAFSFENPKAEFVKILADGKWRTCNTIQVRGSVKHLARGLN